MNKVATLERTCFACPAQWEGTLDTGEYVYIRFRWGHLAITAAPTEDRAVMCRRDDEEARVVFEWSEGDTYNGYMTNDRLVELTQGVLDFSQVDLSEVMDDE
jgi:hypothetical protein